MFNRWGLNCDFWYLFLWFFRTDPLNFLLQKLLFFLNSLLLDCHLIHLINLLQLIPNLLIHFPQFILLLSCKIPSSSRQCIYLFVFSLQNSNIIGVNFRFIRLKIYLSIISYCLTIFNYLVNILYLFFYILLLLFLRFFLFYVGEFWELAVICF